MRRHILTSSLALFLTLLIPSVSPYPPDGRASASGPVADCEGGACRYVAVTFDEAKGQFRVRNDSADRWVKVAASNVSAYASVCVAPGKTEHLPLKSIVGVYRADYAETDCAPPSGE